MVACRSIEEARKGLLLKANENDRRGKKIGGAMDDADGESTFHYLSSIVVSAPALTGAVIGVESVAEMQKWELQPRELLAPGDHRYYYAFV